MCKETLSKAELQNQALNAKVLADQIANFQDQPSMEVEEKSYDNDEESNDLLASL